MIPRVGLCVTAMVLGGALIMGCGRSGGGAADAADATPALVKKCREAGQRCLYAPTKVGLCSLTPRGQLRCVSQH